MELNSVKQYYNDITSSSIEPVANNLLQNRVVARTVNTLLCDCPNHASESKRSLHISTDKQSWFCFGCAVGGDVLHLVEFIKFGSVSHEVNDEHRQSRDWLANFNNMPTLSSLSMSKERLREGETSRKLQNKTGKIFQEIFKFYYASLINKRNKSSLEFLNKNYAINSKTLKELLIGFVPESYDSNFIELYFDKKNISLKDLISTGMFRAGRNDTIVQSYPGRLIFPYWQKGQPRFAIARKTPLTPDNEFEQGKYKKLQMKDEHLHKHICESIDNRMLYNEDILSSKPEKIIIVEGITDAIVLEQQGFPVISPVTVSISKKDWDRIISKLRDVKIVYLCLDNEVSGVGLAGAQKACKILGDNNIEARIITIPLFEKQQKARKELKEKFNISGTLTSKEKRKLTTKFEDDKPKLRLLESLLHDSKTDPNYFFQNGGTTEDFQEAINDAKSIVDFEIDKLNRHEMSAAELDKRVESAVNQLVHVSPISQERGMARIFKQLDGLYSKSILKSQLSEAKKADKKKGVQTGSPTVDRLSAIVDETKSIDNTSDGQSQAGSCLHAMREAEGEFRALGKPFSPVILAEKIADWLESNGGKFFYYPTNESCLFFDNEIYNMDSSNKPERRKFRQFLYKTTGLVDTLSDGRTVIETLANTAHKRGKLRKQLTWIHTDTQKKTIFLNLNNDAHEILKVSSKGIEFLKNGINDDEILLGSSSKMLSFDFDKNVNVKNVNEFTQETICKSMACSIEDASLITSWLFSFLLLDFATTKPATRFEGDASSGKTTAAKIITTILFGEQQQKRSTDAANYHDGATNPLVCLDNIETRQMTDGLSQFLLTSVTGISNEKRQMGTDTGIISETTKCLVNTTGIEALSGDLSEIQSRTLTINFSSRHHSKDAFLEVDLLDEIKNHRNNLLSAVIICTQNVLRLLEKGVQREVMNSISSSVGKHDKARCNDYLSLMFLINKSFENNGATTEENRESFLNIDDSFKRSLISVGTTSKEIKIDSNPIAQGFDMLLSAFESMQDSFSNSSKDDAEIKYQIKYDKYEHGIVSSSAKQLHFALSKVYKDAGMRWPYSSAMVLAQRMVNDADTILDSGLIVKKNKKSKNHPLMYTVSRSKEMLEAKGISSDGSKVKDSDDFDEIFEAPDGL